MEAITIEDPNGVVIQHGRHWDLVCYERLSSRWEAVAYVHRFSGKRVELERPSRAFTGAISKWQEELDAAPRRQPKQPAEILGVIALPRRTREIVREWQRRWT